MWLDLRLRQADGSEYDVSIGAVVDSVENSLIHLIDDDKHVSLNSECLNTC